MHRTEGDNHFNNTFINGPPATCITAAWLNAVQEELADVIETAGLTLKTESTDTYGQLLSALYVLLIARKSSVPSNATDTGTAGQFAFDTSNLYVCVATNTWRKVTISSF